MKPSKRNISLRMFFAYALFVATSLVISRTLTSIYYYGWSQTAAYVLEQIGLAAGFSVAGIIISGLGVHYWFVVAFCISCTVAAKYICNSAYGPHAIDLALLDFLFLAAGSVVWAFLANILVPEG